MRATIALLAVVLGGCTQENNLVEFAGGGRPGENALSGRVCDPERNVWLSGAKVYTHVFADAAVVDTIEAVTNAEGKWTLEGLHDGDTYELYVQWGNLLLDSFEVTMTADAKTTLPDPPCGGGGAGRIAVISGDYDDILGVLQNLGQDNVDVVNGQTGDEIVEFLASPENLADYDLILFAGGLIEEDVFYDLDGIGGERVEAVHDAVRAYARGGGRVWASDWAYDVVEQIWPDRIEFAGDDLAPDDAQIGEPTTIQGEIRSSGLEGGVGDSTLALKHDLDTWPVAESVSEADVVVAGDAPWRIGYETGTTRDAPLLVTFAAGDGQVVWSSWLQSHNGDGDGKKAIQWVLDGAKD